MALLWIHCLSAFLLAYAYGGELSCPTLFNYYPDQYDCTKFYRCVWGKPTLFNCPAGTRWSQGILACDHSANVPCNKEPATKIVYDHYTGNYQKTYDPERKAPDFSVDHDNGHYTTSHPHYVEPKKPELEPYHPDYNTYAKEKNHGHETHHEEKRIDYVGDYQPSLNYGHDYRRIYPSLGYYYSTYYPQSGYPHNYHTSTHVYTGYPDVSYNPYYRVNHGGSYAPHHSSSSYTKHNYAEQYKPTPTAYPYSYVYHHQPVYQEDAGPKYHQVERYESRSDNRRNGHWLGSDLFRAGYGYKRIYVRK